MRTEPSPISFKATTKQKEAYRQAAAAARVRLSKWIKRALTRAIEAETEDETPKPERPKIEIPSGRKLCVICARMVRLWNQPPKENCKHCQYEVASQDGHARVD